MSIRKKEINVIFLYIVFSYVFIKWNFNFIADRSLLPKSALISTYLNYDYLFKIFYYVSSTFYLFFNLFNDFVYEKDKKINKYIFILIIIFIASNILYFTVEDVNIGIHFLIIYYLQKFFDENNYRLNKYFLYILFLSLLLQFFLFRFSDGRPTLSWYDPNYSSYYLFLLYMILDMEKLKKSSYMLIIVALMISSRSFLLSLIVYNVFKIKILKRITLKILGFFCMKKTFVIFILNIIFMFIFSNFYIKNVVPTYSYQTGIDRLTSFNDNSNLHRFRQIDVFRKELISDKKLRIRGLESDEYVKNVKIGTPHNGSMKIFMHHGLYRGLFIIFIICYFLFPVVTYENIAFVFAIIMYQNFLGIHLTGIGLILLCYIANLTRIKRG